MSGLGIKMAAEPGQQDGGEARGGGPVPRAPPENQRAQLPVTSLQSAAQAPPPFCCPDLTSLVLKCSIDNYIIVISFFLSKQTGILVVTNGMLFELKGFQPDQSR